MRWPTKSLFKTGLIIEIVIKRGSAIFLRNVQTSYTRFPLDRGMLGEKLPIYMGSHVALDLNLISEIFNLGNI